MTEQQEYVTVQVVTDELEAEEVCAFLRTEGIECGYAVTEARESLGGLASEWTSQAILVAPKDAERARELLADDAEPAGEPE
jgi:hypothetical protein